MEAAEKKENPRLGITSVSGAAHLFYQFNFDYEERKTEAYSAFGLLVFNHLRNRYRAEGKEKFGQEDFYEVSETENHAGFCIDIGWGGAAGQDGALEILDTAFDYIRNFDPEEHTYGDGETENLIRSGLAGAKELMLKVREEIFEQKRVTFRQEYWDPFD